MQGESLARLKCRAWRRGSRIAVVVRDNGSNDRGASSFINVDSAGMTNSITRRVETSKTEASWDEQVLSISDLYRSPETQRLLHNFSQPMKRPFAPKDSQICGEQPSRLDDTVKFQFGKRNEARRTSGCQGAMGERRMDN